MVFFVALKGRKFLENSWFCCFEQNFLGEYPVNLLKKKSENNEFTIYLPVKNGRFMLFIVLSESMLSLSLVANLRFVLR